MKEKNFVEYWMRENNISKEESKALCDKYQMVLNGIADKILQWNRHGVRFADELDRQYKVLAACGHKDAPLDLHLEELGALAYAIDLLEKLSAYQGDDRDHDSRRRNKKCNRRQDV